MFHYDGVRTAKLMTRTQRPPPGFLLNRDRLGQVAGEIHIQPFTHGEPIGDELQRDHIEKTLKDVDRLGNLNLLCLLRRELFVTLVADDNGTTASGDD